MKKITAMILSLLLFASLWACTQDSTGQSSQDGSNPASANPNDSSAVTDTANETNSSAETQQTNTERVINATLSSGITVDAAVQIPAAVDINALNTYAAEIEIFDFEIAKELFIGNKAVEHEETMEPSPNALTDSLYYLLQTADGYTLSCAGANIYFSDSHYYNNLISFFYEKYHTQEKNDEQFLTGKDLPFQSITETKKQIAAVIETLHITVAPEPLVYTFDETTPAGEDYYYLLYQITLDGMPLSKYDNGIAGDGSWMSGTTLEVLYSANGIEIFSIPYQFHMTGIVAENQQGLTAEEALQLLDDKYNSIIMEGDYTVERIEFEYVPVPDKDRQTFTLAPAWRFFTKHSFSLAAKDEGEPLIYDDKGYVVFHAITGEELINDAGSI